MGVNINGEKIIVGTTRVEGYEKERRKWVSFGSGRLHVPKGIVLTLAIVLAGSLAQVAGSDVTEQVTLQAGKRGVLQFHLQRPPITTYESKPILNYTLTFGSRSRPFCINGNGDIEGFKSPSQISRFTITVADLETSPNVNIEIDNVDLIDDDMYILSAVWQGYENIWYNTQKNIVVRLPSVIQTSCFLDCGGGYIHEVYCRTANFSSTLTCFQNSRKITMRQVARLPFSNWLSIQATFSLPETNPFYCCLHHVTSTVSAATCDDFEWSPGVVRRTIPQNMRDQLACSVNGHTVECRASIRTSSTTLQCYHNAIKLGRLTYISRSINNWNSIQSTFRLPEMTPFSCCLRRRGKSTVNAVCDDFEWPPRPTTPSTDVVQHPSNGVKCFVDNGASDSHILHCRASTVNLGATLTCIQNGREMRGGQSRMTTGNWLSIRAAFALAETTPFNCCLVYFTTIVVSTATCNDFVWPPTIIIPNTVSVPEDSDKSTPVTIRPVNEDSDTSTPVTIRPVDEVSDTSEPVTIRPVNKDSYTSKPVTIRPVDEVSDISDLVIRPVNEDREVSNIIPTDPILEIPVMLVAATEFIDEYSGTCTSFSPQFWNFLCLSMYILIFVMIY